MLPGRVELKRGNPSVEVVALSHYPARGSVRYLFCTVVARNGGEPAVGRKRHGGHSLGDLAQSQPPAARAPDRGLPAGIADEQMRPGGIPGERTDPWAEKRSRGGRAPDVDQA